MINLVSDDDNNTESPWFNNQGVSLPGGKNATYNMYLSPLFTSRNGTYGDSNVIWSHGKAGRLWASNAMGGSRANFLDATSNDIAPNHVYWRRDANCSFV